MKKSIVSFVAVLVLIGILATITLAGITVGSGEETKVIVPSITDTDNGIRLGLDLVGGSQITFEAITDDTYDTANLATDMVVAQSMMRQRLTAAGYTEATVSLQGENRLQVEIPNIKNPEDAVQMLGATAQLYFMDAEGTVWLTGSDMKKAEAVYGATSSTSMMDSWYISLTLQSDAVAKFAAATESISATENIMAGTNYLAIVMDDEIISAPNVSEKISSDTCIISGSFTQEEAQNLANLINIGQLPFTLEQVELRSVGPQLGADALATSLLAGAIGLALVCVFMILVYRLPGVIACIALLFYCVLESLVLSIIQVNLSLPGIAGIILSIGMAVDANVIIFERIKEELHDGKTVKRAIHTGFGRAFTAILDSNITTLIAASVLYFMGTGTIVGFATTLGIGVVLSMFTALTVTHFLLNRMVDFRIRDPKFYGA